MINFPIPEGIENHIKLLKCLRVLLSIKKKGYKERDEIGNLIDALKYNAIPIEYEKFIFIDGIHSNEQIEYVKSKLPSVIKDLNISEILYINSIADKNKAESDIYISFNQKIENCKPVETKNWLYDDKVSKCHVLISKETCRPYYEVFGTGHGSIKWFSEANSTYGEYGEIYNSKNLDVDGKSMEYKGLSVTNSLCKYIVENKKYPTKEEFLVYLSSYYFNNHKKKTLPVCIMQFVNERFHDYEDIMNSLSVGEFKERWVKSINFEARKEMEKN